MVLLRQAAWLLIAFLALARPISADNGLASKQEQVKHQLAAAGAAISQLDQRITGLDRSIADTERRIQRERQQLRLIARAMYAEPESAAMTLLSASSLADALTRFSDLTAAGERAAATERALDQDLSSLRGQQITLGTDRLKADQLRQQLDAQFRLLQSAAAASAAQPAVPRPSAAPLRPVTRRPSVPSSPPAGTPTPRASPPPATLPPPVAPPTPVGSPTPIATPPPAASGSSQQIVLEAFAPLGPAAQRWALRVAKCESSYNPYAVNPSSGASGLFQFLPSTWAHTPYASRSVFDPTANAQAAAWYFRATGQTGKPWSCK